jgi:hypothetical protein
MVEGAIGAIVIFTLIFGVFQGSFLARSHLVAEDAASAGAQAGSVSANDASADLDILNAISRSKVATSKKAVQRIVVYKASALNSSMPSQCVNAASSVKDWCNVYDSSDLDISSDTYSSDAYLKDDGWKPTDRGTSRNDGPDYLGVYVKIACGCAGALVLPQVSQSTTVVQLQATVP